MSFLGVLRRGRASMAREEEGELLHGLARERSVWGEWEGERELGDGSQVKRGRADEWGPRVGRGAQTLRA